MIASIFVATKKNIKLQSKFKSQCQNKCSVNGILIYKHTRTRARVQYFAYIYTMILCNSHDRQMKMMMKKGKSKGFFVCYFKSLSLFAPATQQNRVWMIDRENTSMRVDAPHKSFFIAIEWNQLTTNRLM